MAVVSADKGKLDQSGSGGDQSCRSSPSRPSVNGDAASETSSVHSGDPSDRRDIDIMSQVLSSRSEEYRLLFRLPPEEVLVQDFNCALQENILLQGHMYLFVHHICFYSNIFGFETKKIIPFHEITCVRKAKTAAIFPNAIEIVAGMKKHFFGSFLSRDEAYRLIIDSWAQHCSDAKAHLDHQEAKSETNSQDTATVMLERVQAKQPAELSSSGRSKDANLEEYTSISNGKSNFGESNNLPEAQEYGEESADRFSPTGPFTWQIEDVDAPNILENFTMVAEAKFSVSVEEFFSLFISDEALHFLENFHSRCGDKDFQCSPWRRHEEFGYARTLSFLHPVKVYIGAKLSRCQTVQKLRVYRNSHLMIETSQQVSDVPFADYFHVEGIWDVDKNCDEENGCILRVYSNVAFSKKTMFKGKIEQSTKEECREVYAIWTNNALELLKQKNVEKIEGVFSQNESIIRDKVVGSGTASAPEGLSGHLHSSVGPSKVVQIMPDTKNFNPKIAVPLQENFGSSTSAAAIFRDLWTTFVSYLKSQSHFPLFLVAAFVAILIVMQVSIIILLCRVPEVHLVTRGNDIGSRNSYGSENIEWLEKRVVYLKEEMLMVETRIERMRHEYAMLNAHLHTLERLKPQT